MLRDGRIVATLEGPGTNEDELVRLMVGREPEPLAPGRAAAPGPVLLSASGLSRRGVFADVSFTLRQGEILGFAGLIGAGRTEVGRALGLLLGLSVRDNLVAASQHAVVSRFRFLLPRLLAGHRTAGADRRRAHAGRRRGRQAAYPPSAAWSPCSRPARRPGTG